MADKEKNINPFKTPIMASIDPNRDVTGTLQHVEPAANFKYTSPSLSEHYNSFTAPAEPALTIHAVKPAKNELAINLNDRNNFDANLGMLEVTVQKEINPDMTVSAGVGAGIANVAGKPDFSANILFKLNFDIMPAPAVANTTVVSPSPMGSVAVEGLPATVVQAETKVKPPSSKTLYTEENVQETFLAMSAWQQKAFLDTMAQNLQKQDPALDFTMARNRVINAILNPSHEPELSNGL